MPRRRGGGRRRGAGKQQVALATPLARASTASQASTATPVAPAVPETPARRSVHPDAGPCLVDSTERVRREAFFEGLDALLPLSLTEPPGHLSGTGVRLWLHGDDTTRGVTANDPALPGDLWLTEDPDEPGKTYGMVMVTAHHEADEADGGYVLGFPVTFEGEPECSPAVRLTGSPLGVPLVAWPTLSTGMEFAVLKRRLGAGADAFSVARLRAWGEQPRESVLAGRLAVVGTPCDGDIWRPVLKRVNGAC